MNTNKDNNQLDNIPNPHGSNIVMLNIKQNETKDKEPAKTANTFKDNAKRFLVSLIKEAIIAAIIEMMKTTDWLKLLETLWKVMGFLGN